MKFYKNFSVGLSAFIFSGVYKIGINVNLIKRGLVLIYYTTNLVKKLLHQNVEYSINTGFSLVFIIFLKSHVR